MKKIMTTAAKKRIQAIVNSVTQKDPARVALSKEFLHAAVEAVDCSKFDIDENLAIAIALRINEMLADPDSLAALRETATAPTKVFLRSLGMDTETADPAATILTIKSIVPRLRRPGVANNASSGGASSDSQSPDEEQNNPISSHNGQQ